MATAIQGLDTRSRACKRQPGWTWVWKFPPVKNSKGLGNTYPRNHTSSAMSLKPAAAQHSVCRHCPVLSAGYLLLIHVSASVSQSRGRFCVQGNVCPRWPGSYRYPFRAWRELGKADSAPAEEDSPPGARNASWGRGGRLPGRGGQVPRTLIQLEFLWRKSLLSGAWVFSSSCRTLTSFL